MKTEWKTVFEEEKRFIQARRKNKTPKDIDPHSEESKPKELVGLAISGGGIRSATFALGVLETLKQKNLFKKIDYLSTVSGGGYIGAWLSANCHRNKDWLKKEEEGKEEKQWKNSIAHLRRYSNYLSPKLGLLSADTWSMFTVWFRNTILIQIMILLSMAALLLGVKGLLHLFNETTDFAVSDLFSIQISTSILFLLAAFFIVLRLKNLSDTLPNTFRKAEERLPVEQKSRTYTLNKILDNQLGVHVLVIALMLACFLFSILFWSNIPNKNESFANSLSLVCKNLETGLLLIWICLSSTCFAYYSITGCTNKIRKITGSFAASIPPTLASLLLITTMVYVVSGWKTETEYESDFAKFLAFAFMPAALLGTFAFGSVLLIGMIGRASLDYFREWWSRFGAWLAIYGSIWMLFVFMLFLGPWVIVRHEYIGHEIVMIGTGWIGTTLLGLFAGKSVDTSGVNQKGMSSKLKEIIAKIAPVVFILGLLVALSVVLHLYFAAISDPEIEIESLGSIFVGQLILSGSGSDIFCALISCLIVVGAFSWRVDINEFSLNAFYRHRLTRCFLGASRQFNKNKPASKRNPHPFTGFDAEDDLKLAQLVNEEQAPQGPLHIINCSLNLGGSSDLALHTRHSSNFILTPLYCGSSYPVKNPDGTVKYKIGYMKTEEYCGKKAQPTLGLGISVSGAAASPNSGYHTSSAVSFLLTLFNARLGWWFPNPSVSNCNIPSPALSLSYILRELFGMANEKSEFLSISDGGHFENLAAYELIRRRCKVIIISDGECDPELQLEGLAALIRMCEVDGLAKVEIDTRAICSKNESGWSNNRWAVGKIIYPDDDTGKDEEGYLIYIKASMNGHENTAVLQYKATHPDFPHETTADQFYTENQFESYRSLGKEITNELFGKIKDLEKENIVMSEIARNLFSINAPQLVNEKQFIRNADQLMAIWRQLGTDKNLEMLAAELHPQENTFNHAAFYMCSEMIQLMENVYLDMNLEDTWNHPDNEGWKKLFIEWANTSTLNKVWEQTQNTYGERFISFWERNLKDVAETNEFKNL